jgi:hypothetical protein
VGRHASSTSWEKKDRENDAVRATTAIWRRGSCLVVVSHSLAINSRRGAPPLQTPCPSPHPTSTKASSVYPSSSAPSPTALARSCVPQASNASVVCDEEEPKNVSKTTLMRRSRWVVLPPRRAQFALGSSFFMPSCFLLHKLT